MKRVLSIFIAAIMVVASFSVAVSAATGDDVVSIAVVPTQVEDQIIVDVTITATHWKDCAGAPGISMFLNYDVDVLNPVSYEWGQNINGESKYNNIWIDVPGEVNTECTDISLWQANVEVVMSYKIIFDIIGDIADGDTITFHNFLDYTANGYVNNVDEDITFVYKAPVEDTAAPETSAPESEAPETNAPLTEDLVDISVVPTQVDDQIIVDVTITATHWKNCAGAPGISMFLNYDVDVLEPVSYEWGQNINGESKYNNIWIDVPGEVNTECTDISLWEANVEVVMSYKVIFDIIGDIADGDTITFHNFLDYTANGHVNNVDEDITITYVATEAPVEPEPEYAAPSTAASQARKGCEACGVVAGIRFLATIEKTDDLTGYGMRIEYNGNSVDVDSKVDYSVDGNVVTYTVVVTNAPVGAEFVVAPYAVYGEETIFATAGAYTYNA